MARPHVVQTHLVERMLFHFRVSPEALVKRLPVPSLWPQVVNGSAIVSLCFLRLDSVMLSPLSARFGLAMQACAYRCGVIDLLVDKPEPGVYIWRRYADNPLCTALASWVFASSMTPIRAVLARDGENARLQIQYPDGRPLFCATMQPADEIHSDVFHSLKDSQRFLTQGITSYTPSLSQGKLARIDLEGQSTRYEALNASIEYSELDQLWPDVELTFDSAVRVVEGQYRWIYQGCVKEKAYYCQKYAVASRKTFVPV